MSRSRQNNLQNEIIGKGSPGVGEPLYISIGKFGRPFSYKGAITFYPLDEYKNNLTKGMRIFVGDELMSHLVTSVRIHGKGLVLSLQDIGSDLESGRLTNKVAYIPAAELPPLGEGEFYKHQLIGLKIRNDNGELFGRLAEILSTGANDVYVVINEKGNETLLPAIKSVILSIDLQEGCIYVNPPEWD